MQVLQLQKNKNRNFTTTKQLKKHPVSGQLEINLEKLKEGHRYLVKGNYKIIYKEIPTSNWRASFFFLTRAGTYPG